MFLRKDIFFSLTIVLSILNVNQGVYQSQTKLSHYGFRFQPVNYPGQILSTFMIQNNLLKSCSMLCNENISCRIFDINGVILNQCRLFQGDINIHGIIISSSINNAQVGTIQFSIKLYLNYGQSCSSNSEENRYLTCGMNSTWECPPNTYWNQLLSMCIAQSPILGSICQQNMSMCREDLNYTCLRFNQCGPLSLLIGTTIIDGNTTIAYSSTRGLLYPTDIRINQTIDNSIIVSTAGRPQVIRFYDNGLSISNASVIPQNWSAGNPFSIPFSIYVEPNQKSNLYVSDFNNGCVFKLFNMQAISPLPIVVAGVKGSPGNGMNELILPRQIAVDSKGNLYVSDTGNHRIMLWPPNSTTGSVIAGLGVAGNSSFALQVPKGMFLDENNSYIYVCDSYNHRIQRFSLFGGSPNNGTTVAGGNGLGILNSQLRYPSGIYISKKSKAMYIADTVNNRIQRWNQGDQSGVTIAGDPNGNSGTNSTMFQSPVAIALNDEGTFLYVADNGNNRIQRFQLV